MKKIAFLAMIMVVASVAPAFAQGMVIPFFRSGFGNGQEGFVTVANPDTTQSVVVSVLYLSSNPEGATQQTTFLIAPGGSTGWDPIGDANDGPGSTIQNMTVWGGTPGRGSGTILMTASAPIYGRYLERNTVTGETAMYVGNVTP